MKLRTQNILLAIGVLIIWIGVFFSAKDLEKSSYKKGYQAGFNKGIDTVNVIMDKEFDSVMKAGYKEIETIQIESFPNHSEIKP